MKLPPRLAQDLLRLRKKQRILATLEFFTSTSTMAGSGEKLQSVTSFASLSLAACHLVLLPLQLSLVAGHPRHHLLSPSWLQSVAFQLDLLKGLLGVREQNLQLGRHRVHLILGSSKSELASEEGDVGAGGRQVL